MDASGDTIHNVIEAPRKKRTRVESCDQDQPPLIQSLLILDPILQFLTKATGKPVVPLTMLQGAIPGTSSQQILEHIPELAERGILHLSGGFSKIATAGSDINLGFPLPPCSNMEQSPQHTTLGTLHGSTKSAAKRRVTALRRSLEKNPGAFQMSAGQSSDTKAENSVPLDLPSTTKRCLALDDASEEVTGADEKEARQALRNLFKFKTSNQMEESEGTMVAGHTLDVVLPKQSSYAGSIVARTSLNGNLSVEILNRLPVALLDAFALKRPGLCDRIVPNRVNLYLHQATAIESAMNNTHTLVCTGTGSGKSLCFLIPILEAAMTNRGSSVIILPTKALAQDQLSKLNDLINLNPTLRDQVQAGIIDGDVSHPERSSVAKNCNIIFTNPDTLHVAIIPYWKGAYKKLLGQLKFIVIDEVHMYDGVFGAHVAMVLSRLMRICAVCTGISDNATMPTFIGCSATMSNPEEHFRKICPIASTEQIKVLAYRDDGSPSASKHFFVWNPPIMDADGMSTGRISVQHLHKSNKPSLMSRTVSTAYPPPSRFHAADEIVLVDEDGNNAVDSNHGRFNRTSEIVKMQSNRRHSADETALLLARAIANNVRCIAFCKTRSLVEWVYEKTLQALKSDPTTAGLVNKVESYRGGYTAEARRMIEKRLFTGQLTGVVGTSALELGVDIGGIDVTLHCGYPTSFASLLQQAGRAGRGAARLHVPSLAIIVCFNSAAEQQLWRFPRNLLSRGLALPVSVPICAGLVREHLLCAGAEYPLTGKYPVTALLKTNQVEFSTIVLNDFTLFGSQQIFEEALATLLSTGLMKEVINSICSRKVSSISTFTTHAFVEKPWSKVSLRSIEPVNYKIVDLSHPLQASQVNGIKDERAVMDTIPYSRVFYHAFPGAVIMHRGRKYKIQSMTRPPAFADTCSGYRYGGNNLAAYAKPTNVQYSTRPLSTMKVTVVKQLERIDDPCTNITTPLYSDGDFLTGSLGGNGVVTIRRCVTGFKKLSSVTRIEISRHKFSMPPMEWDTFAFWIDSEAMALRHTVNNYDDGVHALSHALLAVAPLFVPCASSDINCDHYTHHHDRSRVMIFDMRAGGSGKSALLWDCIFRPNGLLDAAIDLLMNCPSCRRDLDSTEYDGGCPACLLSGQCLVYNQNLSRSAALLVGRRMLVRIQQTDLYIRNAAKQNDATPGTKHSFSVDDDKYPRRTARTKALQTAKNLSSARERHVVVGRPTWPLDSSDGVVGRQVDGD